MITLQTFGGAFGEPSASPFCTKAMCMLQLSGLPWNANFKADVRKAPRQKLPVILDEGEMIADSASIHAHLAAKGQDFNARLSDVDRDLSHALMRMSEEHLYFALVYNRWAIDANWERLKAIFFAPVPALMRGFVSNMVRKSVLKSLKGQGLGRFDEAGILERVEGDLSVIARKCENGFLFGDVPTAADCSIGPVVSSLDALPEATLLRERVRSDAVLMAYVERFRAHFYPDLAAKFGRKA